MSLNYYQKNFSSQNWTKSRKLTDQFVRDFENEVRASGHNAWKRLADPNGPFAPKIDETAIHNQKLRHAWRSGYYNKRESVLEIHANYESNKLIIKHVDIDTEVKEKVFSNKAADFARHFDEDNTQHLFGNSELRVRALDSIDFGMNYQDFCAFIDLMVTSLS